MNRFSLLLVLVCLALFSASAVAQLVPISQDARIPARSLSPHATQVAEILGIVPLTGRLLALQSDRSSAIMTPEELTLRQQINDAIFAASLDADSALGEIENERAHIIELRAQLQGRRDRAVNIISVANLITGTGLGIVTNALQFSDSTANVGNSIGVGSGIGSTVLSIIGIRQQRGPTRPIGSAPNMLSILFGRKPVLYSDYPPDILQYLNSVPPGEPSARGTRLQQLIHDWIAYGHLDPLDSPKAQQKLDLLTSSLETKQKLSIDDLTDRLIMLKDVSGRVSLMKRDLADLMRALARPPAITQSQPRTSLDAPPSFQYDLE